MPSNPVSKARVPTHPPFIEATPAQELVHDHNPGFRAPQPPSAPVPAPSQFSFKSPLRVRKTRQSRSLEEDRQPPHAAGIVSSEYRRPQGCSGLHEDAKGPIAPSSGNAAGSRQHSDTLQRCSSIASISSATMSLRQRVQGGLSSTPSFASLTGSSSQSLTGNWRSPTRKESRKQILSRVIGGLTGIGRMDSARRSGGSEGGLARKWSLRGSSTTRSKSFDVGSALAEASSAGDDSELNLSFSCTHSPVGDSSVHSSMSDCRSTSQETLVMSRTARAPSLVCSVERVSRDHSAPLLTSRITAEFDSIDIDTERSIWVAAEIHRALPDGGVSPTRKQPRPPIDLVVIIDNSYVASSSCMQNAVQITRYLMDLTQGYDRFGLYSTCSNQSRSKESGVGCRLYELGRLNVDRCDEVLVALRKHPKRPGCEDAKLADLIQTVFVDLQHGQYPRDSAHERQGHFFILSPSKAVTESDLPSHTGFDYHFICPSVLAVPIGQVYTNSRAFSSVFYHPLVEIESEKMLDQRLRLHLEDILSESARSDAAASVTDLEVSVIPGASCRVNPILGQRRLSALPRGTTMPLVLQVRIPKHGRSTTTVFKGETRAQRRLRELEWAFEEVEAMVNIAETELFTLEMRYKSSAYGESTEHVQRETFHIRRRNPYTIWKDGELSQIPRCSNCITQGWLAYFVSTFYQPIVALAKLEEHFARVKLDEKGRRFLQSIRDELTYRIDNNNIAGADTVSGMDTPPQPSPITSRFSFDDPKVEVTQVSNHSLPLTSLSILHPNTHHNTGATICTDSSADQAQHIWRHMRRDSRSTHFLTRTKENDDAVLESTQAHEIRRKAVANKRSVGADTLRSLAMNVSGGLEAPWMV